MKLLMGGCVGYESPRMQQNLNGIYNPAVILKLYKANVQGSAEEELIAFMGLAHLFGGGAYVFILDNELNEKQEIVKGNWNNPIESKVLKSESRVIYQWDSKRSQYIRNQ